MYCGYQTAGKIVENGICLSISTKFKIINSKNCLDLVKQIKERSNSKSDYLNKLKDLFLGRTVLANYGKYNSYIIDDVTIDKNVSNTSIQKTKSKIIINDKKMET